MGNFFGVRCKVVNEEGGCEMEWWPPLNDGSLFFTEHEEVAEAMAENAYSEYTTGASFMRGTEIDFRAMKFKEENDENN